MLKFFIVFVGFVGWVQADSQALNDTAESFRLVVEKACLESGLGMEDSQLKEDLKRSISNSSREFERYRSEDKSPFSKEKCHVVPAMLGVLLESGRMELVELYYLIVKSYVYDKDFLNRITGYKWGAHQGNVFERAVYDAGNKMHGFTDALARMGDLPIKDIKWVNPNDGWLVHEAWSKMLIAMPNITDEYLTDFLDIFKQKHPDEYNGLLQDAEANTFEFRVGGLVETLYEWRDKDSGGFESFMQILGFDEGYMDINSHCLPGKIKECMKSQIISESQSDIKDLLNKLLGEQANNSSQFNPVTFYCEVEAKLNNAFSRLKSLLCMDLRGKFVSELDSQAVFWAGILNEPLYDYFQGIIPQVIRREVNFLLPPKDEVSNLWNDKDLQDALWKSVWKNTERRDWPKRFRKNIELALASKESFLKHLSKDSEAYESDLYSDSPTWPKSPKAESIDPEMESNKKQAFERYIKEEILRTEEEMGVLYNDYINNEAKIIELYGRIRILEKIIFFSIKEDNAGQRALDIVNRMLEHNVDPFQIEDSLYNRVFLNGSLPLDNEEVKELEAAIEKQIQEQIQEKAWKVLEDEEVTSRASLAGDEVRDWSSLSHTEADNKQVIEQETEKQNFLLRKQQISNMRELATEKTSEINDIFKAAKEKFQKEYDTCQKSYDALFPECERRVRVCDSMFWTSNDKKFKELEQKISLYKRVACVLKTAPPFVMIWEDYDGAQGVELAKAMIYASDDLAVQYFNEKWEQKKDPITQEPQPWTKAEADEFMEFLENLSHYNSVWNNNFKEYMGQYINYFDLENGKDLLPKLFESKAPINLINQTFDVYKKFSEEVVVQKPNYKEGRPLVSGFEAKLQGLNSEFNKILDARLNAAKMAKLEQEKAINKARSERETTSRDEENARNALKGIEATSRADLAKAEKTNKEESTKKEAARKALERAEAEKKASLLREQIADMKRIAEGKRGEIKNLFNAVVANATKELPKVRESLGYAQKKISEHLPSLRDETLELWREEIRELEEKVESYDRIINLTAPQFVMIWGDSNGSKGLELAKAMIDVATWLKNYKYAAGSFMDLLEHKKDPATQEPQPWTKDEADEFMKFLKNLKEYNSLKYGAMVCKGPSLMKLMIAKRAPIGLFNQAAVISWKRNAISKSEYEASLNRLDLKFQEISGPRYACNIKQERARGNLEKDEANSRAKIERESLPFKQEIKQENARNALVNEEEELRKTMEEKIKKNIFSLKEKEDLRMKNLVDQKNSEIRKVVDAKIESAQKSLLALPKEKEEEIERIRNRELNPAESIAANKGQRPPTQEQYLEGAERKQQALERTVQMTAPQFVRILGDDDGSQGMQLANTMINVLSNSHSQESYQCANKLFSEKWEQKKDPTTKEPQPWTKAEADELVKSLNGLR